MTYEKWKPLTSLYGQNLQNNTMLMTIIYKSILSFLNCVFENMIRSYVSKTLLHLKFNQIPLKSFFGNTTVSDKIDMIFFLKCYTPNKF